MRLLSSHCSTRQDGLSRRLSRRKWAEIHANESSAIERKTGVVSAADRVLRAQPFIRSESMPRTLTSECGVRTSEQVHHNIRVVETMPGSTSCNRGEASCEEACRVICETCGIQPAGWQVPTGASVFFELWAGFQGGAPKTRSAHIRLSQEQRCRASGAQGAGRTSVGTAQRMLETKAARSGEAQSATECSMSRMCCPDRSEIQSVDYMRPRMLDSQGG